MVLKLVIYFHVMEKLEMNKIRKIVEMAINTAPIFTLSILSILFPSRLIHRFVNNRLIYKKCKIDSEDYAFKSHIIDAKNGFDEDKAVDVLLKHGALVLNDYFDREKIISFQKAHEKYIVEPNHGEASANGRVLPFTKEFCDFWKDEKLIRIMEKAFNAKIFARNFPRFTAVHPRINVDGTIQSNKTARNLHVDHTSLIQFAIYFTEVTEETSRMQILSGSHRHFIYPFTLTSKNEQALIRKFDMLDCVGGIGSVQIHFGDTLHRFKPVGDSRRLWLQVSTSDGNNILFNPWEASKTLSEVVDKAYFIEATKDDFFSGLYPKQPNKGYKIKNGHIQPMKKEYI